MTKKAAPPKKKTKKKTTKKKTTKKKTSKKAAPKKKTASKKAAPKKKKAAGPKLTGYQQAALDAVARFVKFYSGAGKLIANYLLNPIFIRSAKRGGISHTQIHAAVKAANAKANKT